MMYNAHTSVFVTTDFVNFHRWPDAPASRHYLAGLHRHKFKVDLELSVVHNDREVEYHTLLDQLGVFIEHLKLNWDMSWSCEALAGQIVHWCREAYPDRDYYRASVSEDDENGSTVDLWKE